MRTGSLSVVALLACACGPAINETRVQSYPSRREKCELEFIKLDMNDLSSPQGTWQVVGYVTVGDTGALDPFSEGNRAIVRPRACGMGGEGVAIMLNSSTTTALQTGSSISYAVLRHRTTESTAPKKF
ncbi:MAG TPA: hypothetical protein VHB79_30515 [Polyangiaceae bacterium]|nr:hypothetical protein [Polyangiaceae bacterium]